MRNSLLKLDMLTWESVGINPVLEQASSCHWRNCSFWHSHFALEPWRLPLVQSVVISAPNKASMLVFSQTCIFISQVDGWNCGAVG